jgi:ureidoglycolate hydrolase
MESLTPLLLTRESFAPFGEIIAPIPNNAPYGEQDVQLALHGPTVRFYVMTVAQGGRRITQLTRHRNCTQCLGSVEGEPWWLVVAPPTGADGVPAPDQVRLFRIPGDLGVKLHVGTWHAGPLLATPRSSGLFYNLELHDTNVSDRDCHELPHPLEAHLPSLP